MTPHPAVQRLSRTVNLLIFLGLLYAILHLLGWFGVLHGYGLPGLVVALSSLALGYGIRYGSRVSLYIALGVCAGLSLYGGAQLVRTWTPQGALRLGLSVWLGWRLCRALPAMRLGQQQGAFPLPMSRYGEVFMRRLRQRATHRHRA